MEERARLMALYEEGLYSMTELCRRFGIARKTGYKWLERYREGGLQNLADRSRAPLTCPHRTEATAVAALVAARKQHPGWGPKKLVPYVRRRQPELPLPVPSTAGAILKRHGLVKPVPRRRSPVHPGGGALQVTASNQVWTADFKGEFRTRNGVYCYPLTISDAHTRYLLACQAMPSTETVGAEAVFARIFAEYGLPEAIRTDNGTPFASKALAGLSRLNVWWIKLGIRHQRITPGRPQENGRHERMHRTLKADTALPPANDLGEQQERFTDFLTEFNEERPHEALDQQTPSARYSPSPRVMPRRLLPPGYPGHWEVRRVDANGCIKLRNRVLFVTTVLASEYVGLEEVEDGVWSLGFYDVLLGRFDERTWQVFG
jgi:putative transposase